ncbi:hypothetical protein GCM10009718_12390 [Isoptericola halotolerans]|uniref:DUF4190 domain-containing protein n=1 Tax=Isoptericola halotolerans TaxID=300560 RepID=A0ABX2A1T4_9MICO|nr:hypothetical protein [Isoptericola halotolerans]
MTSTSSPDPYRPPDDAGPARPGPADPYGAPGTTPAPSSSPYGPPQGAAPYGPAQPPTSGPSPYPAPQQQPAGTDGVAIAALVAGLLGTALLAVGLGIAGMVRTKRSGRSGRGLAIAGLVLGVLSTIAWTLLVAFLLWIVTTEEFQDGVQEGINELSQQSVELEPDLTTDALSAAPRP